jgi:hypothetical protein
VGESKSCQSKPRENRLQGGANSAPPSNPWDVFDAWGGEIQGDFISRLDRDGAGGLSFLKASRAGLPSFREAVRIRWTEIETVKQRCSSAGSFAVVFSSLILSKFCDFPTSVVRERPLGGLRLVQEEGG